MRIRMIDVLGFLVCAAVCTAVCFGAVFSVNSCFHIVRNITVPLTVASCVTAVNVFNYLVRPRLQGRSI